MVPEHPDQKSPAKLADRPVRPLSLFMAAFAGIVLAAGLGAVTNLINSFVSDGYYIAILRLEWQGELQIKRNIVAQGVFEGLMYGTVFSTVFSVGAGLITSARCSFGFALRHLLIIICGSFACWCLGGFAGALLAVISPDFYANHIPRILPGAEPMIPFGWVAGSISGVTLGGLMSTLLALVILRANWGVLFASGAQSRDD